MTPKPLTELAPNSIEAAYNTFKGSSDPLGIPAARELLRVTHTARIIGGDDNTWCVKVFLDVESAEVPEPVERAAGAHELTEVDREYRFEDTLTSITYTNC